MKEIDDNFYKRADDHINLSNEQLKSESRGMVSACGWNNREEMSIAKEKTLEYFVDEYWKMLSENLDDYIENFETYMKPNNKKKSTTNNKTHAHSNF